MPSLLQFQLLLTNSASLICHLLKAPVPDWLKGSLDKEPKKEEKSPHSVSPKEREVTTDL